MASLQSKAVKGVAALGVGKGIGRLISFANTIILARILSPDDYGLMAMAMVVCGFITFFNEIGLGSAIIQREEVSDKQLNGAFSIALLASFVLYGITYLLAPSIGGFYNNPQIGDMLRWLAVSFVFGGLATISSALISKNMQFKALAGVEFLTIVVQALSTLAFAVTGYKAWSLVFGYVISQLVRMIFIIFVARWKPTKLGEFKEALSLIKFGLTVTYSRLTWYCYSNAATFIVGKVSGEKQLGLYSMAGTLATLPTTHITSLVGQVTSSAFAKLQNNLVELNKLLNGFTAGLSLINFPVLAGMAITAPELVPILLGPQWLAIVLPMQIMCVTGFIRTVSPLLTQALTFAGKAHVTAQYTTICAFVIPSTVLVGVYWRGIEGVAILSLLAYSILTFILLLLCKKHIKMKVKTYLLQLITPILASLAMVFAVFLSKMLLIDYLNIIPLFILEVTLGIFTYLLWLIYVQKKGLYQLKQVLQHLGLSQQKLTRWPFNNLNNNHYKT
ncbi:MAG: lipopolysaccharide biosynthesis protein [Colwellia sp.]|nr:lipopolysaccharide biosynthesis protein [Colwellia sp.]